MGQAEAALELEVGIVVEQVVVVVVVVEADIVLVDTAVAAPVAELQ